MNLNKCTHPSSIKTVHAQILFTSFSSNLTKGRNKSNRSAGHCSKTHHRENSQHVTGSLVKTLTSKPERFPRAAAQSNNNKRPTSYFRLLRIERRYPGVAAAAPDDLLAGLLQQDTHDLRRHHHRPCSLGTCRSCRLGTTRCITTTSTGTFHFTPRHRSRRRPPSESGVCNLALARATIHQIDRQKTNVMCIMYNMTERAAQKLRVNGRAFAERLPPAERSRESLR